jgi:hypothetical protein
MGAGSDPVSLVDLIVQLVKAGETDYALEGLAMLRDMLATAAPDAGDSTRNAAGEGATIPSEDDLVSKDNLPRQLAREIVAQSRVNKKLAANSLMNARARLSAGHNEYLRASRRVAERRRDEYRRHAIRAR